MLNILIVEDEFLTRRLLITIIQKLGYLVSGAVDNAKEAKEILETKKVDLIFMDIKINGNIDGLLFAKQLLDMPIIFITSYREANIMSEASESNMYGYITKPFDEINIKSALMVAEKFLQKRKVDKKINLGNGYKFDFNSKQLYFNGSIIFLTPKESLLIDILCKNLNSTVSIENIQYSLWNREVSKQALRDLIYRIRQKAPKLNIISVIDEGYKIVSNS